MAAAALGPSTFWARGTVMFSEKQANFLLKNVVKKLFPWANKQKAMADFLRKNPNPGDTHVMIVHIKIGKKFNLTFKLFAVSLFTIEERNRGSKRS